MQTANKELSSYQTPAAPLIISFASCWAESEKLFKYSPLKAKSISDSEFQHSILAFGKVLIMGPIKTQLDLLSSRTQIDLDTLDEEGSTS